MHIEPIKNWGVTKVTTVAVVTMSFLVLALGGMLMVGKHRHFGRWVREQHFGRVLAVETGSVKFLERSGTVWTAVLDGRTRVFPADRLTSNREILQAGSFLMVVGAEVGSSQVINARAIRVFPAQ